MRPITGSRRATFAAVAGLLLFIGGSTQAATTNGGVAGEATSAGKPLALGKAAKPLTHKAALRRKVKQADAKVRTKTAAASKPQPVAGAKQELPDGIANANALLGDSDTRGTAEITDRPPLEAAAAQQRGELDRALTATPPGDESDRVTAQIAVNDQPQTAITAMTPEPAPATTYSASAVSRDTAWGHSSLIGKIFIAFGGMLTLASAARMLVA